MENSFLNVSVQKRMFTVMNPLTDKKYQFINSKSSMTNKTIYKKLSDEKQSDIQESIENYNISETIGDNSIIGGGSSVNCHTVEGGNLILERVKIGKKCTIGAQSLIWPGCTIGDRSILATKSVLKKRTQVGEKEIWKGSL